MTQCSHHTSDQKKMKDLYFIHLKTTWSVFPSIFLTHTVFPGCKKIRILDAVRCEIQDEHGRHDHKNHQCFPSHVGYTLGSPFRSPLCIPSVVCHSSLNFEGRSTVRKLCWYRANGRHWNLIREMLWGSLVYWDCEDGDMIVLGLL